MIYLNLKLKKLQRLVIWRIYWNYHWYYYNNGTGGHPLALKFFFRSDEQISGKPINVGYPVFIKDTKVGSAVTSVDSQDSSIVAIGTTFVDNIYKVHAVSDDGAFNGRDYL